MFETKHLALALVVAHSLLALPVTASPLASDEEVIFFRTVAPQATGAATWSVPVHGWVFEPERSSILRRLLLKGLIKVLGLPAGSDADTTFQSRAEMFLVDSESRKDLQVRIGTTVATMPRTGSDGHFEAIVEAAPAQASGSSSWVRSSLVMPPGDARRFEGEIQKVATTGLGVISDIDDTIKVTEVLDRKEMLKNTFLRPFKAVPGMAGAYEKWARSGAVFHYISGSPWQLYPSMQRFMDEAGFPAGGFHLRNIWSKGMPRFDMTDSGVESYKFVPIEKVLALHPERKFVLVGDSGEKDPEIYGEIARRHPTRIHHIYVRRAPHANEDDKRYEAAFKGLPRPLWSVFSEPNVPSEP